MQQPSSILDNFFQKLRNRSIRIVDLTHPLDDKIPTWSGDCGYRKKNLLNYGEDLFRVQEMTLLGAAGTHIDAPSHLFPKHTDIASIDLKNLIAPLCVIDIRDQVRSNQEYALSKADVEQYEKNYGSIPKGAVIVALTGWSKHWSAPESYRNLDSEKVMRFPKFNVEAIKDLVISISGIGIDTLSPDGGDISKGFPVHELVLGKGLYILENLTNLDSMPPSGGYVITAPLKICGGAESPVRILGLHEEK